MHSELFSLNQILNNLELSVRNLWFVQYSSGISIGLGFAVSEISQNGIVKLQEPYICT